MRNSISFVLGAVLMIALIRWLWLYANAYRRIGSNPDLNDRIQEEAIENGTNPDTQRMALARREASFKLF